MKRRTFDQVTRSWVEAPAPKRISSRPLFRLALQIMKLDAKLGGIQFTIEETGPDESTAEVKT